MKKIILGIMMFFALFLFSNIVNAEKFVEGNFINGEYINKEKSNKTYYMTMQFIKDSQGRIVYCLEPFVDFKTGQSYVEYNGDLKNYSNLTEEQKREIELIIYYGYGYGDRTNNKWYVVTQYLIWKVVDPDANIYFTSSLNGKKIDKYAVEIAELKDEVSRHDTKPDFVKNYIVNYKDNLIIDGEAEEYEVAYSDFEYLKENNAIKVNNVLNNGKIYVKKISNYYQDNVAIFDSSKSQDLIRPGNVINPLYELDIEVHKGDITIDIQDDESVYTVESSLKDTCYVISKDDLIVDRVCLGDDVLTYKTDDLPYGEYNIYQESIGVGYKKDEEVYKVKIDESNNHPFLSINNLLIRNKIEIVKYECYYGDCNYEEAAKFEIRDKNNNLVDMLVTNKDGYSNIVLGYGKYNVVQVSGKSGYTLSSAYVEKIVDEESLHKEILYNYYVEPVLPTPVPDIPTEVDEPIEIVEEIPDVIIEEEILPPNTSADINLFGFVLKIISALCSIVYIIKCV